MIMGQAETLTFGAWLIQQGEANRQDQVGNVGRFWKELPDRAKIRSVAGVMKLLGDHPDWQQIQPALDVAVHEFRTRGSRPLAAAEGPPGPPGRSPYDQPGPDAMRSPFGPVQAGVVQPPPPGEGQPVPQPGWRDGGPVVPVVPADEAVQRAQERAAQWRDDPGQIARSWDPAQAEQTLAQGGPMTVDGAGPWTAPMTGEQAELPYPGHFGPGMAGPGAAQVPQIPVNPAAEARRDALMSEITPEEIAAARAATGIPDDPGMLAELRAAHAASLDTHLGLAPGALAVWTGEGWETIGELTGKLAQAFAALAEAGRGSVRAGERLEEAFADTDARAALAAAQRRQDGYLEHAEGPPPHHDFAALWSGADFGQQR